MAKTRRRTSWLTIALLLLLGLVLFPYGWLAAAWPLFGWVVDALFSTQFAHVVGHFLMYAAVGALLLASVPALRQRPFLFIVVICAVGLLQESLQLATFKGRFFAVDELVDLFVDVFGAAVTWRYLGKMWAMQKVKVA